VSDDLQVNIHELQAELDRRSVHPSRYSLHGGTPEDGFAITREGNKWLVYYSERGGRYDFEEFDIEDAACRALLSRLTG
jgi:hypothetical protein